MGIPVSPIYVCLPPQSPPNRQYPRSRAVSFPYISESLVLPENERDLEKMDECPVHNTHVDGRNSCVACEETGFLFEAKLGNISQIGVVGD